MFKKVCRSSTIEKLNVIIICEEILSTIEIRAGRNYGRFSLYLSSQLMYGITKILFYQTKLFQEYLFNTNWKIFQTKRNKEDFNWLTDLEVPEVPAINEVFQNKKQPMNLHLINEEPYTTAIEHLMRDEMNFGVLPNHEMEKFLLLEPDGHSLNEIRRCRWEETIEIPREPAELPPCDITKFEIDAIESETEIQLAHKEQRESLVVVEDRYITKRIPRTPSKRTIRSPAEETPKKRNKISFANESIPPLPVVSASTLLLEPESILENAPIVEPVPVAELTHEPERTIVPAPENIELIEQTRKTRRRIFFDRQIKLSDALMQKNIQNVAVHTIPPRPYFATLSSAKEHLEQPSVKISNKLWGKTLTKLYNGHLRKPLSVENQFVDLPDFEVEETIAGETVRAATSSKLRDQTAEISSQIAIHTKDTTDLLKTSEIILPTEDFVNQELGEHGKEAVESEDLIIGLPEITYSEEKNGFNLEETKLLEKSLNKTKSKRTSKLSSSSISSRACLTKTELLALMEIRWAEERLIKFHDIISPESYSKRDAAHVFRCCLGFEAEKVVILKQAEPFDTIYIEKYPCYSSENGEDNAST